MAITQNPLIGRASGKFAGAVFSKYYDKNIIRARPHTYRDKQSSSQVAQRSKFVIAQQWIVMFLTLIRTGFANFKPNMSAYAAALGWYLKNGITGTPGSYAINYPAAKFSFGDLAPITNPEGLGFISPDIVMLEWSNNLPNPGASGTDILTLIFYHVQANSFFTFDTTRGAESLDDSIPGLSGLPAGTLHCWAVCKNESGTLISDTVYCNSVLVTE